MTSNQRKSAKLAALIKKTAQKFINSPKQLQKLALTLPLLALFVEEVRAAQGKGSAFEDIQSLTDFVDAQNLTEEQYAEIEESLDGIELTANDVAAVVEEETEKAALLQEEGVAAAKKKAALLESSGEAGASAGGSIASEEAAAAIEGESAAAAATESFELAGLVIPVAPVPLITSIASALGLVATSANAGITTVVDTETATDSKLTRTLKQLKTDGIAFVQSPVGGSVINVELGTTGAALTSTTGVALFGDADRSGSVSEAEDAALQVNLVITRAEQLAEVRAIGNLSSFGIDSVRIDLSNQDLLTALTSNATLAADLDAIRATGLTVTTIDMGSAASLTEAQAATLIARGLAFAADDTITMTEDAGSTHLSTSLKDLQKLGVDAMSGSGVSSMTVDMGGMTAADLAAGAKLASFDSGLNVTLNVANTAEFSTASGMAAQISAANIDSIKMDVLDTDGDSSFATELQALGDNNAFVSQVGLLHTQDVGTILDLGGVNVAGVVSISTTEATDLVDQGVSFAANDQVTFAEALDANSTTLGSTLKDLQKLGVDAVSVTGGMPGGHLHVDFGTGSAINLAQGGLPKFASALDVTLHVSDATQLNELSALATTAGVDLAALGIDHVLLNLADQSAFDALFDSQPVLQASLTATASTTSLENSLDALRAELVSVTTIDMATNAATLTQAEAGFLFEQGLEFAANDAVTLEASGTHLSTSLSELKKLGIDMVSLAGSDGPHYLNVNLGNGPNIDLSSGLPSFGADADINVTLEVANTTQLHQVAQNINNFQQLGVDEVQLNFASQNELQQFLNEDGLPAPQGGSLMDFTVNQVRNNNGVQLDTIDIGGFDTAGSAHLDELQLGSIINAGLHFASADFVTVDANAGSTYLGIHTHNLSQLGVDTVHITDLSSSTSLSSITTAIQAAGVHTLGIDTSALAGSAALATNIDSFNWLASGVDFQLQVNSNPAVQTELGAAINLAQTEVNVIAHTGTGLTSASNFGELIDALQRSGMSNVEVENAASVKINDDLSAALYESGMLHALPSTTFAIDAGDSKVLNTSLKAMADLGVDEVLSAQSVDKLYVGLGENADIASIIAGFTHGSDAPLNDGLFGTGKQAGLVVDQTTFDQFNQGDITDLLAKLSSLGFTEIDVLKGENDSESYQITAQTQVLVPTDVQLLGVNDANALLDVFGTDILDKKIS